MTLKELYISLKNTFTTEKFDSPSFEARELICSILNIDATTFILNENLFLKEDEISKVIAFAQKRIKGEPLQYLLGMWDFMDSTFSVGEGVLIPRPETELLCDEAIKKLKNMGKSVVYDLCSGSGCIGLTVKKHCPEADVYLVEKSEKALPYLLKNAENICENGYYSIIKGDIFDLDYFSFLPKADLILSNPPYIKSSDIPYLQKEVLFEPAMALDGGDNGLVFYEFIVSRWADKLKADGKIIFEIGEDQGNDLNDLFNKNGFECRILKDLSGNDRIAIGRKKPYVN